MKPTRTPAPFNPVSTEFDHRGKRWRITVKRFWLIPVNDDRNPDTLTWSAEKQSTHYPCGLFRPVQSDDVPLAVAKRAAAFYKSVADL